MNIKIWMFCGLLGFHTADCAAKECSYFKDRIQRLDDLRRMGGTLKQLERWRVQSDDLSRKLKSCNTESSIKIASGTISSERPRNTQIKKIALRRESAFDKQSPQTQQLFNTCNFWIAEFNQLPSSSNQAFMHSSCKLLDQSVSTNELQTTSEFTRVKSINECIKPNNLIDKDVQECMQGFREPSWR